MIRLSAIAPVLFLAACSNAEIGAVYQHDQCHRLTLVDEDKQKPVIGAEDITRLPNGDVLISAYDRRTTTKEGFSPEGGLFIVPRDALNKKQFSVRSLVDVPDWGLRPHGIDAIEMGEDHIRIAFINRGVGRDKEPVNQIVTFDIENGRVNSLEILNNGHFCNANDLAWRNTETLYVTIDQSACGGLSAVFENILNSARGKTLEVKYGYGGKATLLTSGQTFPNGIGIKQLKWPNTDEDQYFAVAETRANRISFYPFAPDKDNRWQAVELPGSPDNITVGKPGLILAAVHPNLFDLALYRYNWPFGSKAPSRIVKVTGSQTLTLFDDPTGAFYSAASVAVPTWGKLVIGSVGEIGVLVCSPDKVSAGGAA